MTRLLISLTVLALAGCTSYSGPPGSDRYTQHQDSAPDNPPALGALPDPEPRAEPRSRYGNPASYEVHGQTYHVRDSARGYQEEGLASWYGKKFHGHRTSSGETYDMYKLTAAHRTLPLPTWARVTHLGNGKSTIVRINDRGPFHPERIIDLSWAAAVKLGIAGQGTGRVRVEAITPEAAPPEPAPAKVQQASAPAPAASGQGLYLQVGAFSQQQSARDVVMDLVGRFSFPVAVRPARDIYRVWVGPFASDKARQDAYQTLVSAGFDQPVRITP